MNKKPKVISNLLLAGVLIFVSSGCEKQNKEGFMGSAVVEGITYMVSSVNAGQLIEVTKREGERVKSGEIIAVVDTVQLVLKKMEIQANVSEIDVNMETKKIDINAVQNDVDGAQREYIRVDTLSKKGALPTQQSDNLKTQFEGAKLRLTSSQKTLLSLLDKIKALKIRIDQINDQISNCYIKASSSGIVSTKYRYTGEIISPGNPIYEIAKFDTLTADFFVPQPILSTIKFGQNLRVRIDYNDSTGVREKFVDGKIIWISDEAEFSSKNIQTRESRNELVFRVRLEIDNKDGMLKRGLPVEIWR
jgi:HlyD family secretion protein